MQISPRPKLTGVCGDGLYLRYPGSGIHAGEGFILGKNSPFKNISILGWILYNDLSNSIYRLIDVYQCILNKRCRNVAIISCNQNFAYILREYV